MLNVIGNPKTQTLIRSVKYSLSINLNELLLKVQHTYKTLLINGCKLVSTIHSGHKDNLPMVFTYPINKLRKLSNMYTFRTIQEKIQKNFHRKIQDDGIKYNPYSHSTKWGTTKRKVYISPNDLTSQNLEYNQKILNPIEPNFSKKWKMYQGISKLVKKSK